VFVKHLYSKILKEIFWYSDEKRKHPVIFETNTEIIMPNCHATFI